jgi:hypothetical protein
LLFLGFNFSFFSGWMRASISDLAVSSTNHPVMVSGDGDKSRLKKRQADGVT